MTKPIFTGACTALVTPFLENRLNTPMLRQLIRRQELAGVDALVICGTTGESAALTDGEKLELFRVSREAIPEGLPFIAGTGSNNTSHAVALGQAAQELGADALLVVSPYYNKATEDGLYRHYRCIAEAVSIPVILYNVPSRTGLDIPVSVYKKLAEISNIVGVKEASSDIRKIAWIRQQCPRDFSVWCGNDDLAVPALSLGAAGLISVVSNVEPELTRAMVKAALDACGACGVKAIAGKIATGDTFVGDGATKAVIAEKVHPDCVEMEGAAVSQIAARNGVPCVVLRAMSDNADESGHELLVVKKFSIAEYVTTATAIVARMLESL